MPRRQSEAGKLKSSLRRDLRIVLQCGPQDSNLQPRDSSAPAFPRGLDYLILLDEAAGIQTAYHPETAASRKEAGRSSAGVIVGTHPASL